MGEARFFTIRQCPDCICDLPHISGFTGMDAGVNDGSPQIGTIIRKYFPKDGAVPGELIKAGFPRKCPRHLYKAAPKPASAYSQRPRARSAGS